jgi:ribosomal protein S21
LQVEVRNGRVDKALNILRRKCVEALYDLREREFYHKPSEKRRTALKRAKIREKRRKGAT